MPPRPGSVSFRRPVVIAAALGVAIAGVTTSATAAPQVTDHAATAPVIVVHMGSQIHLSTTSVRAGQITFKVVTRKGDHELQLARLRKGYTMAQAGADIGRSFTGDVAAINRVDKGIDFRGGAEARPHSHGLFTTKLGAGHYVALDQNGNGLAMLTVRGTAVKRRAPHSNSAIGMFSYGFSSPRAIPHSGTTNLTNSSDQPHFVVFERVKASATKAQVKAYFSSMAQGKPTFALRGGTSSGVISPGRSERLKYDLPAGKYVIACFWPDDETGMPHAFMGMWKLITLK